MIRQLSCLLLATVCVAASISHAATESAAPGVRALLLVPGGPVVKLHPLSGKIVGDAVQVGARGLSDPFRPATREFSLAVPDSKQETGHRVVANVPLPAEGGDFIILLEPARSMFKVHVVNARESRFGSDSVLFFNATETTLGAALGQSKVFIKPRMVVFAKPPRKGGKPFYQVTLYQPDDGRARPFVNTRWPHRNGSRCYVFLYRGQNGRLSYQAVDEVLPAVASTD